MNDVSPYFFVIGNCLPCYFAVYLKEMSSEGDISYLPVFSIPINNGKEIIYNHHSSSKPSSLDIGEKAEFLYDPNDLHSARLFKYFDVFSWTIVLMGLAAYLITTAGGYFYFNKGRAQSIEEQLKKDFGIPPQKITDIPDDEIMNMDLF